MSGDPEPSLLVERVGPAVVLTMNRPERRNALSLDMLVRLADAWDEVEARHHRARRDPHRERRPLLRGRTLSVVLFVVVLVGAFASLDTPGAGAAPLPDGACRYVTAISQSTGTTPDELAQVAVPGSDAYAYGVFEDDLREAWTAAQEDPTRTVRCGPEKVEVDLLQQPRLPIHEPKRITTTYRGFTVDARGRVETFSVNGTPIAGRVLVGSAAPAVALGTTVTVSSAYRVPKRGGEHIRTTNSLVVAVRATAPADGFRDLATRATTYETSAGEEFVAHVVGQSSGLQPGASAVWALDFAAREFGATLTVPVVTKPSLQVGPTDPLEAAVLTVG